MHKYNNQDHSMMTAFLAAHNILGMGQFDTWKVNTDAEYHEESTDDSPGSERACRAAAPRSEFGPGDVALILVEIRLVWHDEPGNATEAMGAQAFACRSSGSTIVCS